MVEPVLSFDPTYRWVSKAMKVLPVIALLVFSAPSGAQELWHFGTPNRVYGIYRKVRDPKNEHNYRELRVGHIDATVTDEVFDGKPCKHYKSTAFFSAKEGTPGATPTIRHCETWVGLDGRVLRAHLQYSAFRKGLFADAVFKGDEIQLSVTQNAKSRKATLFASGGPDAFTNPIPNLMKLADKDRPVIEFSLLDPSTAGILKYRARVTGKFKADVQGAKFTGRTLEVEGKEGVMLFYVSDQGELLQIDLPDGATVCAQQFMLFPDGKSTKLNIPPAR